MHFTGFFIQVKAFIGSDEGSLFIQLQELPFEGELARTGLVYFFPMEPVPQQRLKAEWPLLSRSPFAGPGFRFYECDTGSESFRLYFAVESSPLLYFPGEH